MSERFKGLIAHNEDLERLTVKSIQDALAYLLEKKDFDQISIIELCKKAGVSRTSFYSHFKGKKDVVDSVNLEVVRTVIDNEDSYFDASKADVSFYEGIFSLLEERLDIMRIYVSNGFQYRPVYGYYLSLRLNHVSQTERQKRLAWFAALEGVIFDWLKDRNRASRQEISKFCYQRLTPILID